MDILLAALVVGMVAWSYKARGERERIVLLASHLRQFEIEKLMETLSEGYMRALGEDDAQRRQAIWSLLEPAEKKVAEQLGQLARQFEQVDDARSRVMRPDWPASALLRLAAGTFPSLVARYSFDMRQLLALHARAVAQAAADTTRTRSAKAFTLLAELMLLQHSCHWFCKSRNVASARLLLRHQTPYEKVLASVDGQTLREYLEITGA